MPRNSRSRRRDACWAKASHLVTAAGRTRAAIRAAIEHQLKADGLSRVEVGECFASVSEDTGPIDLKLVIGDAGAHTGAAAPSRKKSAADRSG